MNTRDLETLQELRRVESSEVKLFLVHFLWEKIWDDFLFAHSFSTSPWHQETVQTWGACHVVMMVVMCSLPRWMVLFDIPGAWRGVILHNGWCVEIILQWTLPSLLSFDKGTIRKYSSTFYVGIWQIQNGVLCIKDMISSMIMTLEWDKSVTGDKTLLFHCKSHFHKFSILAFLKDLWTFQFCSFFLEHTA